MPDFDAKFSAFPGRPGIVGVPLAGSDGGVAAASAPAFLVQIRGRSGRSFDAIQSRFRLIVSLSASREVYRFQLRGGCVTFQMKFLVAVLGTLSFSFLTLAP